MVTTNNVTLVLILSNYCDCKAVFPSMVLLYTLDSLHSLIANTHDIPGNYKYYYTTKPTLATIKYGLGNVRVFVYEILRVKTETEKPNTF